MPHPTTDEPHGAYPASRQPASPGAVDTCSYCERTIEYVAREHPAPGQPGGGWRHVRPTCARCGEKLARTDHGGWEHDLVPGPGHRCAGLPPEVTR